MTEDYNLGFWREVMEAALASSLVGAAAWGALGGATAALTIKVERKAATRMILLGALTAGGVGTSGVALFAAWAGVAPELIPAAGAASSASYLVGVFGPAIFEVVLSRIRAGRLPGEEDRKDD